MEQVVLVNKKDTVVGKEEKMKAHLQGKLHRAFSVFLTNKKGEVLIQKRAKSKYHSAGLWTNTCCSHPRPKENVGQAAKRRLKEEMGITADLKKVFSFIYKAKLGNLVEVEEDKSSSLPFAAAREVEEDKSSSRPCISIWEYEFDHVFLGRFDGNPKPNKKEVADWQWIKPADLETDIKKNPQKYTPWFKIIFKKINPVRSFLKKNF